jgi:hypothetical protein
MPQKTDLYSVLYSYARKLESPSVNMDAFIPFLEKYAKRFCEEKPEWTRWAEETVTRVWTDINHLAEAGKIIINSSETGNTVYLCQYYAEQIKEAYVNADDKADMPFPDEETLKIAIPREQIKPLDVSVDLPHFLEKPQETVMPIIKLVFPNNRGEALILAPMIPFVLMEFSLIKIRKYLLHHGNKEYIQHKLAPQLIGKEDFLREILDRILIRPGDCLNDLKTSRDAAFVFWTYFCNLVKHDLNNKGGELLEEEIGALQAVYIIEICSNFFKVKANKAREIEVAFRNFELEMEKPPYYFSRETIAQFKDNKGVPLLGQYTQEGLDVYIKKRSTEPVTPDELPDLLYFYTDDGKPWLVKKTKVLSLCGRLFAETRPMVIKAISRRWKKLLKEFRREAAMDTDREFDRLISSYVDEYAPVLKALLQDHKLYLVHEEMRISNKSIPESSRLFNQEELLPLRVLLLIKRKQLLGDIKLLMPFWYTLPILSNIVAFFMNLGKKKQILREEEKNKEGRPAADDPLRELRNSAAETAAKLIPRDHTMDSYLEELISRWGRLLNRQAKDNLVEDVNSLVRDRLRYMLRFQKNAAVNRDTLDKLTHAILDGSEGLRKISEQNALFMYIKLYLIKLLINRAV